MTVSLNRAPAPDGPIVDVGMLPRFFEFLYAPYPQGSVGKRHKVLYGGAGSGKSYSVAQYIAGMFATTDDLTILVVRKTMPSMRITCWKVVLGILRNWGVPFEINRSNHDIVRGTTVIHFRSLDDPGGTRGEPACAGV